ncbi:MAG: c-type cytochrome [Roseibium sp.]|uniref:c-type cytochrome n=1 Tax=Roseibium sp. TaxID=1936156 RepID=UPI00261DE09F|nr:c-type cytochrome [Roseibium sp.]MCV0425529.1 c-type cytochrome [Roseibium sp.]
MSIQNSPLLKSILLMVGLMTLSITQTQAGADTFNSVCAECHTGGIKGFISGAPNINNPASWQKFLNRDTVEKMREIVLRGTKDHKPKGGCASCSDQQVIEALDYIIIRVN